MYANTSGWVLHYHRLGMSVEKIATLAKTSVQEVLDIIREEQENEEGNDYE